MNVEKIINIINERIESAQRAIVLEINDTSEIACHLATMLLLEDVKTEFEFMPAEDAEPWMEDFDETMLENMIEPVQYNSDDLLHDLKANIRGQQYYNSPQLEWLYQHSQKFHY